VAAPLSRRSRGHRLRPRLLRQRRRPDLSRRTDPRVARARPRRRMVALRARARAGGAVPAGAVPLPRRPACSSRGRAEGGRGGQRRPGGPPHAAARRPRPLRPRATEERAGDERLRDVVVIGAGVGGLTAAWQLQDPDTLVLEADDRVGGRIKSFERGEHCQRAHVPGRGVIPVVAARRPRAQAGADPGQPARHRAARAVVTGGRARRCRSGFRSRPAACSALSIRRPWRPKRARGSASRWKVASTGPRRRHQRLGDTRGARRAAALQRPCPDAADNPYAGREQDSRRDQHAAGPRHGRHAAPALVPAPPTRHVSRVASARSSTQRRGFDPPRAGTECWEEACLRLRLVTRIAR
jgi:NAD(P)-binding Rossmann-like domain